MSALTAGADAARGAQEVVAAADLVDAWTARFPTQIERYRHLLADVKSAQSIDMPMLSVLLRELRGMV